MRKLLSVGLIYLFLVCLPPALYAEDNVSEELKVMKQQFQIMQNKLEKLEEKVSGQEIKINEQETVKQDYERKITDLEARLSEKHFDSAQGTSSRQQQPSLFSKQIGSSTVRLMDISFDSLFTAGGSTARESEIDKLQAGSHDPKKRGFTTQNLEFSMLGAVDPYFNGEVHLVYQIDSSGESQLEVEEAFLTTQTLPYDLQLKAGTFFVEFGRLNLQHPHSWDFVDQPVVNSRMFGGDGLRGPGARLSWLAPLPWYSEILGGIQNANGETAFSFLSVAGEDFAGITLIERDVRTAEDFLYSTRWLNSLDLNEEITLNVGVSSLWGPNASGLDNQTNIYGTDFYVKWNPVGNDRGFPFASWQTELMKRDYEAGEEKDNIDDWGLYSQVLWGFKKNWVAGMRYDLADGDGVDTTDHLRDRRRRVSPNLTWYPTEFSKVRLQYNYDKAEHIDVNNGDEHSIWLQYEFMLGSHPKHKF